MKTSHLVARSLTAGAIALACGTVAQAQTLEQIQTLVDTTLTAQTPSVQGQQTASVVATICPQGQGNFGLITLGGDLQARCNEVVGVALGGGNPGGVGDALLQWTVEEASAQGTTNIDIGNAQLKNIGARLVALRGGAAGLGLSGLSFGRDGQWPGGALGGAASSDSPFSRLGFFLNGDVQFGDKDATALESGFDFDSKGITAGVDYRLSDQAVVGAAFGYTNADADLDLAAGNLDADGYSVSIYGSFYPSENTYVDVSLVRGWNDFDQRRNIVYNVGVPVNQVASSNADGDYWSGSIAVGYQISRQAWSYGPYARFELTNADVDGFTETMSNPAGAGNGLGLRVNDQSFSSRTVSIGGQVAYAMSTSWGVFLPSASVEYVHEFSNDGDSITGSFVNDPTATTFNLRLDDGDSNYFKLGVGASAQFAQGRSAFLYYQTLLGYQDLTSHTISAGLRFEF